MRRMYPSYGNSMGNILTMGKNAKYKKIKKLANKLPVIGVKTVRGQIVSGAELIEKEVKEVEGKPVDILAKYRKKTIVPQPLNHNRRIKDAYNVLGGKGVAIYTQSVKNFVANETKKTEAKAVLNAV